MSSEKYVPGQLSKSVADASSLFHRLVLLVGPSGAGKTKALEEASAKEGWPLINVNLQLSELLLDLTQRQRALKAAELFGGILEEAAADPSCPLLLDNLELLFSTDLMLDPLKLLQHESRNRTLVAAWPGTFEQGKLTYAEPGHPEYRQYLKPEALVVGLSADSAANQAYESSKE